VASLREVLDYAVAKNVAIAFEPEPGMFIDTMSAFEELLTRIGCGKGVSCGKGVRNLLRESPEGPFRQKVPDTFSTINLRLTLDVGHLQCQGELPIPDVIRRWSPRLANIHIEDMHRGVHEHLMFGEGEIDFPPILRTLADVGYSAGIYVELSRHSHEGPIAARRAFEFLTQIRSCPST
jgi:L-ribulose-5-phosphate 3-epimerase